MDADMMVTLRRLRTMQRSAWAPVARLTPLPPKVSKPKVSK